MRAFIFLYPIKKYFDTCLVEHLGLSKDSNNNFRRINDIIDVRYRQKGYVIYWLMFGAAENPKKPDLSTVSNYVRILKEDTILAAGVSFKEHTAKEKYPDLEFILRQMPNLTELAVGGFHQWDCVNKLAKHAYQKGIPVFIDEDTTEEFFKRTSQLGDIPLIREEITFESLGLQGLKIGLFRKMREGKPWFIQI